MAKGKGNQAMKVYVLTDSDGCVVGVYSSEAKALRVADCLEAESPELFPVDSLCVDDYIVE
jgi:hypothetical protein